MGRRKLLSSMNCDSCTRFLCSSGDARAGSSYHAPDSIVGSASPTANDYLMGSLPSTMKAAVFWEPGRPMSIEELQMPRPKSGETLIKTRGMSLCFQEGFAPSFSCALIAPPCSWLLKSALFYLCLNSLIYLSIAFLAGLSNPWAVFRHV